MDSPTLQVRSPITPLVNDTGSYQTNDKSLLSEKLKGLQEEILHLQMLLTDSSNVSTRQKSTESGPLSNSSRASHGMDEDTTTLDLRLGTGISPVVVSDKIVTACPPSSVHANNRARPLPSTEKMLVTDDMELPPMPAASRHDRIGIGTRTPTRRGINVRTSPMARVVDGEPSRSSRSSERIRPSSSNAATASFRSDQAGSGVSEGGVQQQMQIPPVKSSTLSKMLSKLHLEYPAGRPYPRSLYTMSSPKPTNSDPRFLVSQLCQASREGAYDWAKSLLEEGADVNGLDAKHRPPLFYAVCHSHLDVVKLLVDNDAVVGGANGQSSAMVLLAVFKENMPVLRFLMEQSPPVSSDCWDPRDGGSRARRTTPLSLAVQVGRLEAIKMLLDHGADVHETSNTNQLTPLCMAVERGDPDLVRLLLEYHADINSSNSATTWGSNLTPLHIAAYHGHSPILSILLSAGANVAATCSYHSHHPPHNPTVTTGTTALHLASTSTCVDTLLSSGAKVHAIDSKHRHPLSAAVHLRHVDAVKALLRHGSPVNAQDYMRETALEIACRLFILDAKTGAPQDATKTGTEVVSNLRMYCEIADDLVEAGANSGSRLKSARILRAAPEYERLKRGRRLEGEGARGKWEMGHIMDLVVEMVETASGGGERPEGKIGRKLSAGGVKGFLGGIVAESLLAKVVTGER